MQSVENVVEFAVGNCAAAARMHACSKVGSSTADRSMQHHTPPANTSSHNQSQLESLLTQATHPHRPNAAHSTNDSSDTRLKPSFSRHHQANPPTPTPGLPQTTIPSLSSTRAHNHSNNGTTVKHHKHHHSPQAQNSPSHQHTARLTQREHTLNQQAASLDALSLKLEQLRERLQEEHNNLDRNRLLVESKLSQREDQLHQREAAVTEKERHLDSLLEKHKLRHQEQELHVQKRLDALTKKEIQLENSFAERERTLLHENSTRKPSQHQTVQCDLPLPEPLPSSIHKDPHTDSIHEQMPHFHTHHSSSNVDPLEEKYSHLQSISHSLLEKKDQLERFEKELLLREETLRTEEPHSQNHHHQDTQHLQEIAINVAQECKQAMHELYLREQSLQERELKLKDMVKLVQSIQDRQHKAKEELNRAIKKDEKKIQEKLAAIERREEELSLMEEKLRAATELLDKRSTIQ